MGNQLHRVHLAVRIVQKTIEWSFLQLSKSLHFWIFYNRYGGNYFADTVLYCCRSKSNQNPLRLVPSAERLLLTLHQMNACWWWGRLLSATFLREMQMQMLLLLLRYNWPKKAESILTRPSCIPYYNPNQDSDQCSMKMVAQIPNSATTMATLHKEDGDASQLFGTV